ncbi:sensor histidine kinase [Candidatus Omnitrophota bacterium]
MKSTKYNTDRLKEKASSPTKRLDEKDFIIQSYKFRIQLEGELLSQTITKLRQLQHELEKKNEELSKVDQLKSQFVANVSHEFKNPLAIIKESLGIVIDGILGKINPKQEKVLKSGKNSIERLIRLVTNLLNISMIESGKTEMKREEFDVASLVDETLRIYERDISKKQITLKEDISQDIGLMWADKDKLSQVIINLLSNAIRYTPNKGIIAIKLDGSEKEIHFEISDTGPGIPKEDYGKVFDKFERINAEKQEGTGLGLPIAKDIVELHKGKVWVESEIGKGSRFIFVLPRDLRDKNRPGQKI